jgi:hypothetical protein
MQYLKRKSSGTFPSQDSASARVDAYFGEGFGMAPGEIVALRTNMKGRIQGSEGRSSKTGKTKDIETHRPSS